MSQCVSGAGGCSSVKLEPFGKTAPWIWQKLDDLSNDTWNAAARCQAYEELEEAHPSKEAIEKQAVQTEAINPHSSASPSIT